MTTLQNGDRVVYQFEGGVQYPGTVKRRASIGVKSGDDVWAVRLDIYSGPLYGDNEVFYAKGQDLVRLLNPADFDLQEVP